MSKRLKVKVGERWYTVEVEDLDTNPVQVLVDGDPVEVDLDEALALESPISPAMEPDTGQTPALEPPATRTPSAIKVFRCPMPGVIVSLTVKEGDQVVTGDEVCVLEAMKMQQSLRADWSGIVRAVHVRPGQQVQDGDPIIELE